MEGPRQVAMRPPVHGHPAGVGLSRPMIIRSSSISPTRWDRGTLSRPQADGKTQAVDGQSVPVPFRQAARVDHQFLKHPGA